MGIAAHLIAEGPELVHQRVVCKPAAAGIQGSLQCPELRLVGVGETAHLQDWTGYYTC